MSTPEAPQARIDPFANLGPSAHREALLRILEGRLPERMHHGDGDEALPVLDEEAPNRRRSDGANVVPLRNCCGPCAHMLGGHCPGESCHFASWATA